MSEIQTYDLCDLSVTSCDTLEYINLNYSLKIKNIIYNGCMFFLLIIHFCIYIAPTVARK